MHCGLTVLCWPRLLGCCCGLFPGHLLLSVQEGHEPRPGSSVTTAEEASGAFVPGETLEAMSVSRRAGQDPSLGTTAQAPP